jgi:hypothetical protein
MVAVETHDGELDPAPTQLVRLPEAAVSPGSGRDRRSWARSGSLADQLA